MVRTVSIRRSLLVNIVGVIVALSATIIVVSAVGSRRAVSRLSASVITRTTEQVRQRLVKPPVEPGRMGPARPGVAVDR